MGNVNSNGSNSVVQHFTKTYTTFSGVDITALFDNMTVMTLQGLAVSITREKVPVYTFGKARAVSISRGKRGIAGTLQFVLFDRDALYNLMVDKDHYYYAHADEVNWLTNTMNPAAYVGQQRNVGGTSIPGLSETQAGTQTYDAYNAPAGGAIVGVGVSVATPAQYADQIWPFDATLVAQNEYGQGAWSSVIGIEIINEGGGISMDDLTNEEQCTYIAIHRHPWTAMDRDRDSGATEYEMSSALLSNTGKIFSAVQNN